MKKFPKTYALDMLKKLQNHEIDQHYFVSTYDFEDMIFTKDLLGLVLSCDFTQNEMTDIAYKFISLGVSPDKLDPRDQTPLSIAVSGKFENTALLNLLLKYHTKGHESDYIIVRQLIDNFEDKTMLERVLSSGKININITQRGRHILHYLCDDTYVSSEMVKRCSEIIFRLCPEITINATTLMGLSPLSLAITKKNRPAVQALLKHEYSRIIGGTISPQTIIDFDAISGYNGNFWKDYPQMITYAVETNKLSSLPKILSDIFIF